MNAFPKGQEVEMGQQDDGALVIPERRYAIFADPLRGEYAVVVEGDDMLTAPNWGGFVRWLGGVRPATTRIDKRRRATTDAQP